MASETAQTRRRTGPEAQTPESIRQRLAQLIRHYVESRSPAVAGAVVRHIELLCAHPAFEGDSNERCALLRLRAHWRWLAGYPRRLGEA